MTLPAGTRLGPYEILAPLGAGGMGEVYRARDRKLDRDVAVKVLPESVAADPDTLARFEREAKAIAALSHPNILAIHDFGTHEGIAYAVMELLEGETLRGKLDAGPISQKQAVDYALQVVKGLSAAHEKGIVHRDLKPENLFVSRDGHVKILDFGLAKRVEAVAPGKETSAPTGSGHTEPGTVMGTAGYMSPEQVKGFPVDHRSDIFAFGAILYELLSGQKAFKRDTNAETIAAILMKEPPELSETGRNISGALDRIVKHCLEKDRERRFQTARDIAFSLSEQSSPAAGSAVKIAVPTSQSGFRIAVLPFKCGTADADVLALADGLSEEIVSGLSRFRYLSVVASASADGARYVVEGSIRRGGSDLRVIAQLVDVSSGARLWSETYRRDLRASSMFAVQDDVAGRIVATVADSYGVLVHSIRAASGQKDDVDLTAVEWQFQYFAYREQITPTSYAALKSRLESAARRNDRQSDLWACLAQVYVDEYAFGFASDATSLDRALAAARRAVELDRANQFALVALAQTHFFRQDLAAFGPAAERAMALNPLNTDAVGILGLQIVHTGEFERGAAIVRRAMELNPNHAGWMHFAPLWEHFHKGEYEQALERANRVDVPGLFWPYLVMASACGHLGRHAEAAAAVRDLLALDPEFAAHARGNVGTWHFASGLMEPILEGLRKAGLSIPETDDSSDSPKRSGTVVTKADRAESGADSGQARGDEGFWVAVLPFKYGGTDASLTALAEGLAEEIVTGLSRFSYLRVIARSSTSKFSGESGDIRRIGEELGARYVMEGTLRQVGSKLRLAVQLVDTVSGAHLWAESFERAFSPESLFELQDDLVPRIVSTVADMDGVLPRSMSEGLRGRPPEQLSPYEAVLRSFAYFERYNPEELTAARSGLEAAVRKAPAYADAWAMLSCLCAQDYVHGYELQADALEAAASAARRAVQLGPSNPLAYFSLAQSLSYQKDFESFRDAAERAVELNPMDGNSVALLGELLTYAGSADRGMQLAERAKRLNPNHPGWYWFSDFYRAFSQANYRGALGFALKVKLRGNPLAPMFIAAASGQLGEADQGSKAVSDLLKFRPELPALMRKQVAKIWNPEYSERFLNGLSKAGLSIPETDESSDSRKRIGTVTARPGRAEAGTDSGQARADKGFWVAVLPFKCSGADASLTALADGLTEEIVTGLSRFSYLRVISRTSPAGGRSAGKELGARYVMEGSLRQVGSTIRLAVQLVDAASGAHLWAETFDRPFRPEEILALQDELVPRIVSTVADQHGVLTRSISAAVRKKSDDELSPYEAVFRVFGLHERMTPQEHANVRALLERVVRDAPDHGESWAMLATLYSDEFMFGFNVRADPLGRALAAAQRAVEAAPTSPLASQALAQALFFRRERQAFRPLAERTIALNRMDGATMAFMGLLLACSGDWEHGCAVAESAMRLNPHFPGWYRLAAIFNAYRTRDYRAAIDAALRIQMPGYFWTSLTCAAAFGQLGEEQPARKALEELVAVRPEFARAAHEELGKWFDPDLVEHFVEGLRKAGLETAPSAASHPMLAFPSASGSGAIRADEGFRVAVLPFKYGGADTSLKTLAEGLTEEIVTGLSRFSYLRVISRGSAPDAPSAGKELGARYIMEGSLRQAGTKLRLAVQLVDAVSGAHLWAENYERIFSPEAVFELQDELVPRIVSTVADMHGVLPRSMSEVVRLKSADQMSPYEALLRSFGYNERFTPEDLAEVRTCLERAVQQSPGNAECWAMLSLMYANEYGHWDNAEPDSLDRSLRAARTAVEAAPLHSLPYYALAQALFFKREIPAFRVAAERAVSLNPMDGATAAFMGLLIAYAGDWERGCALSDKGSQLNPNHPGWYRYTAWHDAYRKKDYRKALDVALHLNAPKNYYTHAVLAICYAQLGQMEEARNALRDMLSLKPNYAEVARELHGRWIDPDLVEQLMDGLRKAGLEIASEGGASAPAAALVGSSAIDSGAARADEGFWVAVLPFKSSGNSAELTALAEGLTEEIVTGLSRFSYLRVIARGSTAEYSSESGDVRTIGKKLGARYVMEGGLRRAGTKLRVAVQLVDAVSGAHLWAENFERTFTPETVFELQDDLVPRIVSTVADMYGVLTRSMSEALRGKADDELSPHEAVLSAFGYMERVTAEEHARVRRILERAVRMAPNQSDAWAMLANLYWEEHAHGLNPQPDPLGRALLAARRAVEAAPSNNLAHYALASTLFFQKDFLAFRSAAEKAIELNRMDASVAAFIGNLIAYSGDWERGIAVVESAMQLNPRHPGWYWFANFNDAYRRHDYRGALGFALKLNQPGNFYTHAVIAAAYAQLGMREEARKALQELLAIRPDFAKTAREEFERWFHDLPFVEHNIDGLRKAGLEIALEGGSTKTESGAARAEEGFWVAVLPFKFAGSNAELKELADGLSEEIVTGLSRFSYLRVIARGSTAKYSSESVDVRSAGKELGARYVMEGSLRQAGAKLRLAVQLVDAVSGAHLWAENYERAFSPGSVFELQDDLVPRIVSTCADRFGVLARSISDAVRNTDPVQLSPYEALMRAFGYHQRLTAAEHAEAREALERAVERAPSNADCWAMLSWIYSHEHAHGFNVRPEPLERALAAARRAVDIAPSNPLAQQVLAVVLFFRKETAGCLSAAERAMALNPLDTSNEAIFLIGFTGDWERGCALIRRAMELNPHHPRWYGVVLGMNEYRGTNYRAAVDEIVKANAPDVFWTHALLAAAHGQLGELPAARSALRDLLAQKQDFARSAEDLMGKWFEPQMAAARDGGAAQGGAGDRAG